MCFTSLILCAGYIHTSVASSQNTSTFAADTPGVETPLRSLETQLAQLEIKKNFRNVLESGQKKKQPTLAPATMM